MSLLSRFSGSFSALGVALVIGGAGLIGCSEREPINPETYDYTQEEVEDLRGFTLRDVTGDGVVDMMTYNVTIYSGEVAHVERRVGYITDEARQKIGTGQGDEYLANAKRMTPELQSLATAVRNSQYSLAKKIDTERFNNK